MGPGPTSSLRRYAQGSVEVLLPLVVFFWTGRVRGLSHLGTSVLDVRVLFSLVVRPKTPGARVATPASWGTCTHVRRPWEGGGLTTLLGTSKLRYRPLPPFSSRTCVSPPPQEVVVSTFPYMSVLVSPNVFLFPFPLRRCTFIHLTRHSREKRGGLGVTG